MTTQSSIRRIRLFATGALAATAIAVSLLAAAAPAGADDKLIKIGALLPMSGPGAYFGAQDRQGIELALERINRAGLPGG